MKTLMSVVVGIIAGIAICAIGVMLGCMAVDTVNGNSYAMDHLATTITMVSHDVEDKIEDAKKEVDHQIWRVENTKKVQDTFGDTVAEWFWDLTR